MWRRLGYRRFGQTCCLHRRMLPKLYDVYIGDAFGVDDDCDDNSVLSSPVQPGSAQSSPVQFSPVQPGSAQSSPVQFSPVQSSPVQFSPFSPVQFSPAQSNSVQSSPVQPGSAQSSPIQFSPVQFLLTFWINSQMTNNRNSTIYWHKLQRTINRTMKQTNKRKYTIKLSWDTLWYRTNY